MSLSQLYHYINYELADRRSNDWFLVSSPVPGTIISLAYLYFILKCGPKYMENRPAYSCSTFIKIYDTFQIIANAMLVYLLYDNGWFRDYGVSCMPTDFSVTPKNMQYARISLWLLWLKLFDYIETCVFVLRKKNRQISLLHVYHHISSVFMTWMNVKYYCSGMALIVSVINCAVHVIMYTYYLLSSMGPKMQKLLQRIKPLITMVQMSEHYGKSVIYPPVILSKIVLENFKNHHQTDQYCGHHEIDLNDTQFVFLIIHTSRVFYPGCPGVEVGGGLLLINLIINFILFCQFYQQNYVKKTKQT